LNFTQLRDFASWFVHIEISISEYKLSVNYGGPHFAILLLETNTTE